MFSIADYVIFVLMLLVSAAIGVYYACSGGKQKTTAEFLLANRSMKIFPVAMSLFASFLSAIAMIGIPADVYRYGGEPILFVVGNGISLALSALLFVPVFYELKLVSVNQYLEMRFGRILRSFGCAMFCIYMMLYMSIVLYTPSLALNQVTGISLWACVLSTATVCIFYTTIGGLKAVVWTDTFQTIIMIGSVLAVCIKGSMDVGGVGEMWRISSEGDRLNIFNFDPDPTVRHTVWSFCFGYTLLWTSVYAVNQATVQRYISLPSLQSARRAVCITFIPLFVIITLSVFGGIVTYAKYHDCDPISTKLVSAPDQIYPLFVMDTMRDLPGIPGLFVAGILSGALSSVSSGVNSLAAVTLEDVIKVYYKKDISDARMTIISKVLAVGYGILSICLVVIASQIGQVAQASLTIAGVLGGPLLGLFTLGIFLPWVNHKGAIVGTLSGLAIGCWVGFGAFVSKPISHRLPVSVAGCPELYMNASKEVDWTVYEASNKSIDSFLPKIDYSRNEDMLYVYRLSYLWLTPLSFVTVIVCGLLTTAVLGGNKFQDVDPKLISPLLRPKARQNDMPLNSKEMEFLTDSKAKSSSPTDTSNSSC